MSIDQIALWESAAEAFNTRHQLVEDDHLALPTPCEAFDVAALIEHATGTQIGIGQVFGSTASEGASWTEASEAMRSALAEPGSTDGSIDHPAFGEVTKELMLAIATNDMLIHSWDLARSIGVDETLPEQNLQPAINGIEGFPPSARAALFGAPIEIDAAASLQTRMLGVAGRQA